MAFDYHLICGERLTQPQEELLETIENLPCPFGGISKLKDLRAKTRMIVEVFDRATMIEDWESYISQYNELHDIFYGGEHWQACHRHQGEIGDRRDFALSQIRQAKEPREGFLPLLGIYSRTFKWWSGSIIPKVGLITDNIKDYARHVDINDDIVFGLVFIQEMMHAYFDAFNSKGFPSILSLDNSFSEFAMLTFIDESPAIRFMLTDAKDYVISRIGKEPRECGYGIEMFVRAGEDAIRLIKRYRDISNWTERPFLYKNSYDNSMRKYHQEPSEENATKVFEDILGILGKEWEPPLDPIQPGIREKWGYARQQIETE